MTTGMLWYFGKADLMKSIQEAAKRYETKYGRKPDLCLVHPNMLADITEESLSVNGVIVRPYRPVLPGHIWIGVEDKQTEAQA